jgi:hypothetical protein
MEKVAEAEVTLQTLADKRFGPLSEAECKLLEAAPRGQEASCGLDGVESDAAENDPVHAPEWQQNRTIRAVLIQWLCIEREAVEKVHRIGISVAAARIDGLLDLSFLNVPFPLTFVACW